MDAILDTNFLITLEREGRRRSPSRAGAWLASHQGDQFYITFAALGEIAAGQSATNQYLAHITATFPVLPWQLEISWRYGELYRDLAGRGLLIGTNDLWIAARALVNGMPLVTNNTEEFSRVPGLTVFGF